MLSPLILSFLFFLNYYCVVKVSFVFSDIFVSKPNQLLPLKRLPLFGFEPTINWKQNTVPVY